MENAHQKLGLYQYTLISCYSTNLAECIPYSKQKKNHQTNKRIPIKDKN